MGDVGITLKIMPTGTEIDLEALKERVIEMVPDTAKVQGTDIAPVAFGLKAVMLDLVTGDESPDELVDTLSEVDGVARIEIEKVGRLF
ncbi:MAG: elongation factor 1-beta [Thermoplasmatota archaeon]